MEKIDEKGLKRRRAWGRMLKDIDIFGNIRCFDNLLERL